MLWQLLIQLFHFCSLQLYRDYRSIYIKYNILYIKVTLKPHVPKFSTRPCTPNQAQNVQIIQKFKSEVLSLKIAWPATDDLDPGYHGHCLKDDYRTCFLVKVVISVSDRNGETFPSPQFGFPLYIHYFLNQIIFMMLNFSPENDILLWLPRWQTLEYILLQPTPRHFFFIFCALVSSTPVCRQCPNCSLSCETERTSNRNTRKHCQDLEKYQVSQME